MELFPATRQSLLMDVVSQDGERRHRAFDLLISAYWRPVYKHVRLKWKATSDDASDLVQAFFTSILERETLTRYHPSAGRFHVWLRTCLDHFIANERVAEMREKRGGKLAFASLDFPSAEAELADTVSAHPETLFYQEWVRSFFGLALQRLERECQSRNQQRQFELWKRYDMLGTGESYADLAHEFHLPVATVTNDLAALRRRFRKLLLETLREVTADEREFRNEARSLLGVDA